MASLNLACLAVQESPHPIVCQTHASYPSVVPRVSDEKSSQTTLQDRIKL